MSDGFLFTNENVTEGHRDKRCDQVSDGVLDAIMEEDPEGRVACEDLTTTGIVFIAGEITTTTYIDIPKLARRVIQALTTWRMVWIPDLWLRLTFRNPLKAHVSVMAEKPPAPP